MAPKRLIRAAEAFAKKYPFIRSSDGACGRCLCGSRDFIREQEMGRVLHLIGSRVSFPGRNAFYQHWVDPDPSLYHVAVEYKGWVLDITRRQFQPRSRFPFIQPLAQVRKEWLRVTLKAPI